MGRKRRIEAKGLFFHVIQRGNNKEYVFQEDRDKGYLIKQFKRYNQALGYKVYGFVIMGNHYHFIIQTLEEKLQTIMHRINSNFSHYYNDCYQRSGHVFQGRYTAILIQDEKYLLGLLRYIHQNPMRAKLVPSVTGYKWSSDVFYRENIQNTLVSIDMILNILAEDWNQANIEYRKFMDMEELQVLDAFEEVACVEENVSEKMNKFAVERIEPVDLDNILWTTGVNAEEFQLIKSGSRKRALTKFKIAYVKAGLDIGYTMKVIGNNIKINQSAIKQLKEKSITE